MSTRKLHVLVVLCSIALLAPGLCSAQAQLFKVGPAGDYATISDALVDLLATPLAVNLIKVQAGVTTVEHLSIPATFTTGTIGISGGWDYSFLHESGDPADTVISGGDAGSVIDVRMAGGTLIIRNLSITQGQSDYGGGIRIEPTLTGAVRLENLVVNSNTTIINASAEGGGGGIYANLSDSTTLEIIGCDIDDNRAAGPLYALGAGTYITAAGTSVFSIMDSTIRNNVATAGDQIAGVGMTLAVDEYSTGTVADCVVEGNTVQDAVPNGVLGTGMNLSTRGNAELTIERNRIVDNNITYMTEYDQAIVTTSGETVIQMTDSIIAGGKGYGLNISANGLATFHGTNLTVAANGYDGILCGQYETSSVNLSNTISYGNAMADLNIHTGAVDQVGNIIGIDPEFVDLPILDLRVEAGSVAVDAGVANPPGGLGDADIRGGIRNLGAAPDAGAYEGDVNLTFSDGFELGSSWHWSTVVGGLSR